EEGALFSLDNGKIIVNNPHVANLDLFKLNKEISS
ncbi:MAG: ATP-dependent 6-phosphofructokinase, partial [Leuconostoc sp.]|nr:ATP-dependent 6-phosphofructokinase [Leuconostoc sp.]